MPSASAFATGRPEPLDRALAGVVAALAFGSFAVLVLPIPRAVVAPGLDICLDTATTLVTLSVAVLSWARYRERAQTVALFQAAAFAVLAIANAAALVVALSTVDGRWAAHAGSQVPLYVASLARLSAAALLGIGGAATLIGRDPRRPVAVVLIPTAVLVILIAVVTAIGPALPPLTLPTAALTLALGGSVAAFPGANGLGVLLQLWCAALFLWAASVTRRVYLRDGAIADRYLAVGLVIAAFSQLQFGASSGASPGLVGVSDALRVAFDVVLLLGILAEARTAMDAMRRANVALERLKDAEADRAVLEERARMSRDLHDGLAQDLWLAKLKSGRLARQPELGAKSVELCRELDSAIDSALEEARETVVALRLPDRRDGGFAERLTRSVEEVGDRFGLRTEVECEGGLPMLPARIEAELLRIAQEAVNNAGRHADATAVRVSLSTCGSRMLLSVSDNGRGFEPATVRRGFGLTSMHERAERVGGHVTVASRPADGTSVRVDMPVDLPLPPAGVEA